MTINPLAPALKMMPLTSMPPERYTFVILEDANVAVSEGPSGMVEGIQFAAWFHSPVAGLIFHVALLAKLLLANESTSNRMAEEFDIRRKKKRTAFSIAWFFQMIAIP